MTGVRIGQQKPAILTSSTQPLNFGETQKGPDIPNLDLVTLDFFLVPLVFSIASSESFDGPDVGWLSLELVSAAANIDYWDDFCSHYSIEVSQNNSAIPVSGIQ